MGPTTILGAFPWLGLDLAVSGHTKEPEIVARRGLRRGPPEADER